MVDITTPDSKSDYDNLTASEKDEIRSDVEELSAKGWQNLSDSRIDRAIKGAIAERNTIYVGDMARTPTLDGDLETFLLNLSAHKCEIAEGGQAESESSEGGSSNYTSGGSVEGYLDLTRYGRTAKRHVRNEESISIVRSY